MAKTRALWRQAWPISHGIGMVLGSPPLEAFEALIGDPEEARLAHERHQAYRKLEGSGDLEPGH